MSHESLYIDFYEITMAYTYFKEKMFDVEATFDMFVRKIPDQGGYIVTNGLHDLVDRLLNFKFEVDHIEYLRQTKMFDEDFLTYLSNLKLTLTMTAMPEGSIAFANEPLVTISGPLIQAQLIETLLLASINYPTLVATKARRITTTAKDKAVVEFGARRAHGFDAALAGARAAIIGGFKATSNTLAAFTHDLPLSGTLAHSYIQMHDSEYEAFLSYARINPTKTVLLVDTYDTLNSGVPNAIKVAKEYLIPHGYRLYAIRLDSGDLAYLSKKARKLLDEAGLNDTLIIASNSLDEHLIMNMDAQGAKIDAYGIGEAFITSKSSPVISGVYKLVEIFKDGQHIPKIKLSDNIEKVTNPAHKKVVRFYDHQGMAIADVLFLKDEVVPMDGFDLFDPVSPWKRKWIENYTIKEMHELILDQGKLVYELPSLDDVKTYAQKQFDSVWPEVTRLVNASIYYVDLSQALYDLKQTLITQSITKK
ncbi:MAG: nicotinate phosphoribosyltransferase [Erysipelotrichia bacterium]|jgi:nicotinate phosphoribosyltransferase|nr:nicotinate phosphoribosyltransferase [Erysipelotrichia bacterium]